MRANGAALFEQREENDMTNIQRIGTTGKLSESVQYQGVAYLSGKLPADLTNDIEAQSHSVLQVMEEALTRAGSSKSGILTAHIYLKHRRDADAFNRIWNAWLPAGCAPARICVEANMLNDAVLVEITVIAAVEG